MVGFFHIISISGYPLIRLIAYLSQYLFSKSTMLRRRTRRATRRSNFSNIDDNNCYDSDITRRLNLLESYFDSLETEKVHMMKRLLSMNEDIIDLKNENSSSYSTDSFQLLLQISIFVLLLIVVHISFRSSSFDVCAFVCTNYFTLVFVIFLCFAVLYVYRWFYPNRFVL